MQGLDELMDLRGIGSLDDILEFAHKSVKDSSTDGILEEVGIKEIFSLDHGIWVLCLDEVVEAVKRSKVGYSSGYGDSRSYMVR